ncbi:unnamed protein product [Didymodactylos carnosus]|uniref:Uncharacterized protein n=1 Tax=Didymodactylos carnosus TaxID=1234261 RepID=A0A8S2DVV4_9BILA|nr:unnamed protein product [Didymodactylos carnosus]CAF3814117.1 unnamed protein product [Didymodactylos carnosus]
MENSDILYGCHHYIMDLYAQIKEERSAQAVILPLYRRQWISQEELNALKNHVTAFNPSNCFISLLIDQNIAAQFVQNTAKKNDTKNTVLFEAIVDSAINAFTDAQKYSQFEDEYATLLYPGAMFITEDVVNEKELNEWDVHLTVVDESSKGVWKEIDELNSYISFGHVLDVRCQVEKTENCFGTLLKIRPRKHENVTSAIQSNFYAHRINYRRLLALALLTEASVAYRSISPFSSCLRRVFLSTWIDYLYADKQGFGCATEYGQWSQMLINNQLIRRLDHNIGAHRKRSGFDVSFDCCAKKMKIEENILLANRHRR